jgi:hypothetical protein
MRVVRMSHIVAGAAALGAAVSVGQVAPASACSVFDRHPCPHTVCSVFQRRPCFPEILPPIGEDLRLTIETPVSSAPSPHEATTAQGERDAEPDRPEQKIDNIRELFGLLRSCWVPPPLNEARPGMQMSVRFAFKNDGEIIATPRLTYVTPDSSRQDRDAYRHAIDASLDRCTPIPFTQEMGGAIAGRPIAIRFVDNRSKS